MINFLSTCDRTVAELALALREMALEEAPEAVKRVYQNHPWFGFGPKMKNMFCYIATARSHVNLGFCRGASLSDPIRVLEGEGKMMCHVKFRSERDVERPFVRHYIRARWNRSNILQRPDPQEAHSDCTTFTISSYMS